MILGSLGRTIAVAAATACLSFAVIASAHGAPAVSPNTGSYEAPLGGIQHLTFRYSTYPYPHVDFMTIEERQAGSTLHDYFPGYAVVATHFNFAGEYFGRVLRVTGQWTTPDTVTGVVTLPNGTSKQYTATRKITAGGGGFGALPNRQQGVHPADGHYSTPRVGGLDVEFRYHGTPEATVLDFRTVGHGGHEYFAKAAVHDGAFTWTSKEHPKLEVIGHWTSAEDVVGEIRDGQGALEFHARLQH
jgi:hypothetical protein